jgi:hypothetical protein
MAEISTHQKAGYIRELVNDLINLTKDDANCYLLLYLLSMARAEADRLVKDDASCPGRSSREKTG